MNMETRHYWEENGHTVKYDKSRLAGMVSDALARSRNTPSYNSNDGFGRVAGEQLNFAAPSEDEAEYPPGAYLKKGKVSRQDPMSHRIIEKRRRDRMNNCLADLSRLIPPEYLKKGRGRVEKTEIIEMAIRHLKYLQERANAAERGADFRAGFQDAVAEVMRFLAEVHGYGPADGLYVQLAAHMQSHCDAVAKGVPLPREKPRSHPGSSSETASSSSSSQGYSMKPAVIAQAPLPAPPTFAPESYEERPQEHLYAMECDRGSRIIAVRQTTQNQKGAFDILTDANLRYAIRCVYSASRIKIKLAQTPMASEAEALPESEPLPLDGRRKREATLRAVRKPEHNENYLHSYKFKNSIERRFSRSQDNERCLAQAGGPLARAAHGRAHAHKRRRAAKPAPASTSGSGSTEDARDTSPQDTSSESPHHNHYEKPAPPVQYVPVFALNALGKYYVPLSIDYACLQRYLGPYDVLDARTVQLAAPLHPVTIHVNFQPCHNYHVKREPNERDQWRAV